MLTQLSVLQASAATLTDTAFIVPPGEDHLSAFNLGTPTAPPAPLNWAITLVEWEQSTAVQIGIEAGNEPGTSTYSVFVTLNNNTPDNWDKFELSVEGPATFTDPLIEPVTLLRPAPVLPQAVTTDTITFDGLTWIPNDFVSILTFGLDVTPPIGDEPVVLTLTPSAVPEPASAIALLVSGALLSRRRRNRRDWD